MYKEYDMQTTLRLSRRTTAVLACLALAATSGCQTKAQTGALAGAGVGALIGQLAGGSTQATLIGGAVGTGVGYLVGNEMDKKKAKSEQAVTEAETKPLAGTSWQLTSIVPQPPVTAGKTLIVSFRADGTAATTKTFADGTVKKAVERYRIVGETLILNQDNYVVNVRFTVNGDQLIANTDKYSMVFTRLSL
jgi:hypothetical protein